MTKLGCRGFVLLIVALPIMVLLVMASCFAAGQETPEGGKSIAPIRRSAFRSCRN